MCLFQDDRSSDSRRKPTGASRWGDEPKIGVGDVIKGFELDATDAASASLQKFFAPPEIPKSWQPKFLRLKSSRFEPEKPEAKNLTPGERRSLVNFQELLVGICS